MSGKLAASAPSVEAIQDLRVFHEMQTKMANSLPADSLIAMGMRVVLDDLGKLIPPKGEPVQWLDDSPENVVPRP
ncbi:hypothetical protein MAGNAR_80 [Mycobacterium phage Magnar]|nr:hypothetical protein MAGNAR_80 [Mycobacterium phage Magnar]